MFAFFFLWLQYMFEIDISDSLALTILLMCMIYHGYLGLINLIDARISHHLKQKSVRAGIDDESTSSYLRSRRDASGAYSMSPLRALQRAFKTNGYYLTANQINLYMDKVPTDSNISAGMSRSREPAFAPSPRLTAKM